MSTLSQFSPLFAGYAPAVVKHIATGWFIEYYVTNPFTQTLERRKFRLNNLRKRCRTAMEFRVQANTICSQLNVKLANGWNPFNEDVKTENPGAVPIKIVYEQYFRDVEKDLRPDTLRGYKAFSRRLLEWCDKRSPDMLLKDFSDVMAVRYLDEQRQKNNWVNATFNNNLVSAQAFFTWCVKKKFIEKNPFYGISKKKKEAKKRTVINADARAIMREWFMNNNPGYLLICELVFQSLIRPTEISKLRVSDVDLEHKVIHLDGSITKTKYSRKAVLSDELIEILGRNIQGANQDDFLISNGYLPGKEPISSRMYRKTWDKMRKQCHLPDTMQLYSLRDTGIISLFDNGADANTVKGAADHHNLNITSIYCDHVDDNLVEKVRKHSAKF